MGDVNLDMTKSKAFLAVPYTCAAVGAAVGLHITAATSLTGLLTAGAVGAVAGGVGLPMALAGVAILAYVGFVGLKETLKALKKEGAAVPLGMAVIAMNCAKALFVTPFQSAAKLFKSFGHKQDDKSAPPAQSVNYGGPSKLSKASADGAFNSQAMPATEKPAADAKPSAPAPKPPGA